MERQTTIKKLFYDEGIQFAIPPYQRAYSWEVDRDRKQVEQFIIDIKEQNPRKKYFLGHFLFEKDEYKENKYWVIDGQQRLTTVIIFFSCLIRELERRQQELGKIFDFNGEELEIWRISENYIMFGKKYKFETVPYDNPFFESVIYINNDKSTADTSSARRILAAKKVITKVIEAANTEEILNWRKILDDAVITTFEISDKVQATQIFAFQNDRGKDLTTLEKLKAYLMHKMYSVCDEEDPEHIIKNIESVFSDIYKQSERIKFDEDQVLNFHNIAFLSGWENPLNNVKEELKKAENKEQWIKDFVINLKETFINVEIIEKQSEINCAVADILMLDTHNSMPFLLKLFHYHKENNNLIEKVSRLVEHILFKLEFKIADYRTNSLPYIAKKYNGNEITLEEELIYYEEQGFQDWWDFNGYCKNFFTSSYHFYENIKYVLWKYENYLREQHRRRPMTPVEFKNKLWAKRLENSTDHITPRDPNFTTYSEDFKKDWLNNIGNLVLMVWGDNSSKKNFNPVDKMDLFDSDYSSHKEIRDILFSKSKWGAEEINERREKIVKFVLENWNIE